MFLIGVETTNQNRFRIWHYFRKKSWETAETSSTFKGWKRQMWCVGAALRFSGTHMPWMKSFIIWTVYYVCVFFSNVVVLSLKQSSWATCLLLRGHVSNMSVSENRECNIIFVFGAYHKAKTVEGLSISSIVILPPSLQCFQSTVGTMQNEHPFKIYCKYQANLWYSHRHLWW